MLAAAALIAVCTTAGAQSRVFNEWAGYDRGFSHEWSGFYIGGGADLNAGTNTWNFNWAPQNANWTRMPPPPAYAPTSGGSLDFTAGYNQEVLHINWGTLVLGVAGDFALGSSTGRTDCINGLFDCKTTTSNFFALRGVLGFVPGNLPMMVYVTGGAAGATFVDQKIIGTPAAFMQVEPINLGITSQRWGSVIGFGGEYRVFEPRALSPVLNGSIAVTSELLLTNFSSFNVEPHASVSDNSVQLLVGAKYYFN